MNKTLKVFAILIIAIMLVSISTSIYANSFSIDAIKSNENVTGNAEIAKIGSVMLTYITNIGMVASVLVLAILGFKYMIGSPEQKSEFKGSFKPFLVGAILLFGASTIAKIITSIAF